jgi:hypothetical protein
LTCCTTDLAKRLPEGNIVRVLEHYGEQYWSMCSELSPSGLTFKGLEPKARPKNLRRKSIILALVKFQVMCSIRGPTKEHAESHFVLKQAAKH